MKKGLLILFTGHGKGKTTAALGLVFRSLGHGQKVCIIQFIKGSWKYGELYSAERFKDLLDFHVAGRGFTWKSPNIKEDTEIARKAWILAKEMICSQRYDLIVLDEITYLVKYGMIDENEIVEFLLNRPKGVHIVVTGRDAPQSLMEAADLVTVMEEIKHPFKKGIKAQKGIEF